MDNYDLFNTDCILGAQAIPSGSVRLGIYDPPFGIHEADFDKHYQRDASFVIPGYREAPDDYEAFTLDWMTQAKEIMQADGAMYVFSGHTNLRHILNAAYRLGLHEINHCIWKYNFGTNTKKKFVTSHYHILYLSKSAKAKVIFNTHCRFGSQQKVVGGDVTSGSLLYRDLEDVFVINRDYAPKEAKNENKLPLELLKKLIQYSSRPGDVVCDFFMGNFTTAYAALGLGRRVTGFELNKAAFDYHMAKLTDFEFGCYLKALPEVKNITPRNQGRPVTQGESSEIVLAYQRLAAIPMLKKHILAELGRQFGRGRFSIKNILDKNLPCISRPRP